jgi:UDP-2-acetamido-3-amino-2,3-dideoxy-glucuronate N-acetyltransferase
MIKVVVVGSGYWGKNLVRNFYALGALAGICDKDPRVLQSLQEMYDGVATVQRFDDILDGSGPAADAIAIATPAESHYQLTRKALLAGKHVFVEKPLSLTVGDG